MASQVPWGEACMAMLAMLIVLGFVLFYYCIWPLYRGFKKRKERERELYENDPRWDNATFNFSPRIPKDSIHDKKYSRLAACSRTSSMRSDAPIVSREALNQSDHCPPNYSELFETTSSLGLGTPPSYTSKPPSVENSVTDLVETESVAATPTKPTKVKKNRKKNLQPPVTVEVTPPQEPDNTHQSSKPNISDIV